MSNRTTNETWEHQIISANCQRLHVVTQGQGPLVLLVHGHPQFWYSWHHQLPALAAAGYRVAVPDMRGYGRSSKPGRVDEYRSPVSPQIVSASSRHSARPRQ
jgi:pimeloyl-ACP methyl ester carboxylesterase